MTENKDKSARNTATSANGTGKKQITPSKSVSSQAKTSVASSTRTKPAAQAASSEKTEKGKNSGSVTKSAERKSSATSSESKTVREKSVSRTSKADPKTNNGNKTSSAKSSSSTARTKTEKTQSAAESSGGGGGFVSAIKRNKTKSIIIAAVSVVLILALVLGLVFGLRACANDPDNFNPVSEYSRYGVEFTTNTKVGYYGEVQGTTERVKPIAEERNESEIYGNSEYPQYGKSLTSVIGGDSDKQAARSKLIQESSYLTTSNTRNGGAGGYKWMDKNGYLYNGTTAEPVPVNYENGTQRQLYKHTAANGLYGGNVSDDEPGIIKTVKMQPRGYTGYGVTGVYAPAGEVIKIELSEADMNATGGIEIHIGQALYNGKANNIWTAKNQMQRFPVILNTLIVDKTTSYFNEDTKTYTAYVGSFVGGPLYIRNEGVTFTATISGGVRYSHFILGYTTQKEFEENAQSSAPYFDLEVWDRGVLHSGPKQYAKGFSYEDLYKAAVLWDKVASVTTTNGTYQGIVFIYDPFVAAGEAVAFPGQMSVNCPLSWMSSSLNYNQMVTSGAWGNFHEYHHNFQNFGVGYTGEVTNNALTLVSYSLFTEISQARQPSDFGAAGLGGWNQYTSAPWALHRINDGAITGTNGLAVYSTLLHNFGQDVFIAARNTYGANYFNRYAQLTHQDFSCFAQQVSGYAGSLNLATNDYPVFVPASSVYQTGRTFTYDGEKREITTMQPYVIPYGAAFTVDLRPYNATNGQYVNGSVVISNGFQYRIKNVDDSAADGTLTATDTEGVYTFQPGKNLLSGKIYVTLEITTASGEHTYNGKQIADVELILGFEQSHETNKMTLTRTTYTYDDKLYDDAVTAYEAAFKGYSSQETIDHTNPTQNCNTDIWFYTDTSSNREKYPNVPEHYFVHENTICVIDGKLYAEEEGTYRIYLRGRLNCALYYSTDGGKTYKLGATIKDENASTSTANFRLNDENTYFDLELNAGDWIFIKEVLICCTVDSGRAGFIGVGMSKWTKPMFTMVDKYYDKDNNEVASEDDPDYHHTITHYYNYLGVEVDESVANNAQPVAPASAAYVNAYRTTYERIESEFETEYFYTRKYTYNYTDNITVPKEEVTVTQTNYVATGWGKGMPIENITDGKTNTYIHTNWQVSASKPLELTFDLGGERKINRISFSCRNNNGMLETPKAFTIEGSLDGETLFTVASYTDAPRNGNTVTVNFDDVALRYCRIIISAAHQGNGSYYIVIGEITFTHATEVNGGDHIAPDSKMLTYSNNGWYGAQADSTFGHIYVGNKNATATLEFEGTRFGILASNAYGRSFEVYIDGKKVDSIDLKADDSAAALVYLCDKLSSGKHRVEIKCTGEANIDSFVIYNET